MKDVYKRQAPNIANICCNPKTNILGIPSLRASVIGSFPIVLFEFLLMLYLRKLLYKMRRNAIYS